MHLITNNKQERISYFMLTEPVEKLQILSVAFGAAVLRVNNHTKCYVRMVKSKEKNFLL